jgi:hypothetical protein
MSQATFTAALTIGELEASFPVYCKALRILIREERTIEQIQRSVCWHRLGPRPRNWCKSLGLSPGVAGAERPHL